MTGRAFQFEYFKKRRTGRITSQEGLIDSTSQALFQEFKQREDEVHVGDNKTIEMPIIDDVRDNLLVECGKFFPGRAMERFAGHAAIVTHAPQVDPAVSRGTRVQHTPHRSLVSVHKARKLTYMDDFVMRSGRLPGPNLRFELVQGIRASFHISKTIRAVRQFRL